MFPHSISYYIWITKWFWKNLQIAIKVISAPDFVSHPWMFFSGNLYTGDIHEFQMKLIRFCQFPHLRDITFWDDIIEVNRSYLVHDWMGGNVSIKTANQGLFI